MSAHCHVCHHAFRLGDKAYAAAANGEFVLLCESDVLRIPPAARQEARAPHGISIHAVKARYQPGNSVSLDRLMILDTVQLGERLFDVSRSVIVDRLGRRALPSLPGR